MKHEGGQQEANYLLWEITESEEWLAEKTRLIANQKLPKRRLEFLAGRLLLQLLLPTHDVSLIEPDENGKPHLPAGFPHVSISHSWPYVAAMVSHASACGIDIQVPHRRMPELKHKFLSEAEMAMIGGGEQEVLLSWCVKEAGFKKLGRRGVDFIAHLPIVDWEQSGADEFLIGMQTVDFFIEMRGMVREDFCLCFTL